MRSLAIDDLSNPTLLDDALFINEFRPNVSDVSDWRPVPRLVLYEDDDVKLDDVALGFGGRDL